MCYSSNVNEVAAVRYESKEGFEAKEVSRI